jgi:hypothetical protein
MAGGYPSCAAASEDGRAQTARSVAPPFRRYQKRTARHPAGGDWIVVARVDDARLVLGKVPLVFFAGAFSTVSSR